MKWYSFGRQLALVFLIIVELAASRASRAQALGPTLVADQARAFSSVATPGSGSIEGFTLYEVTDAAGNTYQTATYNGTVHLGSFTFTSPSIHDDEVVIAKRDAAGTYQWAVTTGGVGTQRPQALAVDAAGSVYVTGYFNSATAGFGPFTLSNASPANKLNKDVFVCKLSASGAWQWAASAGGGTYLNGEDIGTAVAVDAAGSVYVAGTYDSSVAFFGPAIQLDTTDPYASSNRYTVFVAKLSATTGAWQWARRNERPNSSPDYLVTDAAGSVYLALRFGVLTQFGSFVLQGGGSSSELAVVKLSSAGVWQWATNARSRSFVTSWVTGLRADAGGGLYLTGYFNNDTLQVGRTRLTLSGNFDSFVAKLNAATGQWRWAVQTVGAGYELLDGVLPDGAGHLYVGGSFREAGSGPQFGATTLRSAGGYDIVVAQLDTAGTWQWARRAGGPSDERAGSSYVDGAGQVWVAGTFDGASLPLGTSTLAASPTAYLYGSGAYTRTAFGARLGANALASASPTAAVGWELYPNPARGSVTVAGLAAGQAVELLDAVGRRLLQATVPARGPLVLVLPPGLAAGLYLVRAGAQARRLAVE